MRGDDHSSTAPVSRAHGTPSPAVAQAIHQRLLLAAVDLDLGAVDHVHQRRRQHDHEVGDLLEIGRAHV